MSQISSWKKIVDNEPSYDYRKHIKSGFIHYSFGSITHLDDFCVNYGTYPQSLTVKSKSYKKKIDIEKNSLKITYVCLFNRYNSAKHRPDKKVINAIIYETYEKFNRKVSKILEESGFSYRNRQTIIVNIVSSVIEQCRNAPISWATFGQGLKKNLFKR